MAFKDSFKKLDLSKATNIVSSVTNNVSQTVDKFKTSDSKTEEGEHTIDSVDSLNCYLQSLQAEASPAVMMALQSQLQVLKYVQSPSMMLMAVDNIMLCLHKALKSAEDETTKENLKETFSTLIQSFIFAIEAKLRYEIDSAREESIQLLAEAGDLLMSSVTSTAMMVVPAAAGQKIGRAIPKMVNVFAQDAEQKSFLGRLIMVKGKKALIEEKKAEFDKTLNYIFETLDNYSALVGPSIQLHGMLKRYADVLVERYTIEQYDSVAKQINDNDASRLGSYVSSIEKDVKTIVEPKGLLNKLSMISAGANILFKTLDQVTKSHTKLDYESVRNIKRSLQSDLKNYDSQIEKIDVEIAGLEAELNKTSLLQISRKGEFQRAIAAHKTERARIDQAAMEYRNKLTVVSDIIDPINEKIESYTNNLYRIVEKYKYEI